MSITTDELAALLAKTTPGPWAWLKKRFAEEPVGTLCGPECVDVLDLGDETEYYPSAGTAPSDATARLIALAPTLAAEVIELRARVLELEAALRKIDVGDGWAALIARAALNQTGGAV